MEELFEFFSSKKMIEAGQRVQGKFGPLIPNPEATLGKKSRRVRSNATGTVIRAVGGKKWLVKRDQDSKLIGVRTCMMKIINHAVGVPTDELETTVVSY